MALSAAILDDLREEYLDAPVEVSQSNRAQQNAVKEQREKQEYEEEYLTRLPVTKAEKQMQRQLTTIGTLGDEITGLGRKRKLSSKNLKGKKRNAKRKRFH